MAYLQVTTEHWIGENEEEKREFLRVEISTWDLHNTEQHSRSFGRVRVYTVK